MFRSFRIGDYATAGGIDADGISLPFPQRELILVQGNTLLTTRQPSFV